MDKLAPHMEQHQSDAEAWRQAVVDTSDHPELMVIAQRHLESAVTRADNAPENIPALRIPEDSLGYYEREEIDRDFGVINGNFHRALGDDGNPYLLATSKLEKDGNLTVLDAGCGSGHALYELTDGLRRRFGQDTVTALAVNAEDFSTQSQYSDVRKAYRTGQLPYIVGKVGELPVRDSSVDLIYSYEVFQHNSEKDKMLFDLVRILSPGGRLVFNTDPSNEGSDTLLSALNTLKEDGLVVKQATISKGSQRRDFYVVSKPSAR